VGFDLGLGEGDHLRLLRGGDRARICSNTAMRSIRSASDPATGSAARAPSRSSTAAGSATTASLELVHMFEN
jgi:hypothetical protein